MPITSLFNDPAIFVAWALAVVVAITVHEFAHALAGYLQGDNTAEHAGRLTLDPRSHVDMFGNHRTIYFIVTRWRQGKN